MVWRISLALLLVLATAPVQAGTYKWVDERGVINYSNAPPPSASAANSVQAVEERLSVYPPDPTLGAAAARFERMEAEERQRGPRVSVIPMPSGNRLTRSTYSRYVAIPVTVFRSPPFRQTLASHGCCSRGRPGGR